MGDKMNVHQYINNRHDQGSFSRFCNSVTPIKGRMDNTYVGLRWWQKELRKINNPSTKKINNQYNGTIGILVEQVASLFRSIPRIEKAFVIYATMLIHKRLYTYIETNKWKNCLSTIKNQKFYLYNWKKIYTNNLLRNSFATRWIPR